VIQSRSRRTAHHRKAVNAAASPSKPRWRVCHHRRPAPQLRPTNGGVGGQSWRRQHIDYNNNNNNATLQIQVRTLRLKLPMPTQPACVNGGLWWRRTEVGSTSVDTVEFQRCRQVDSDNARPRRHAGVRRDVAINRIDATTVELSKLGLGSRRCPT